MVIEINHYREMSKKEALDWANRLSNITGIDAKENYESGSSWFKIQDRDTSKIEGAFFYSSYMEEDVDLTGGDELAI